MIWYVPVTAEGYAVDRYSFLTERAAQAHVSIVAVKSPAKLQRPKESE